jgi:hypothetical protein
MGASAVRGPVMPVTRLVEAPSGTSATWMLR